MFAPKQTVEVVLVLVMAVVVEGDQRLLFLS
jgi:hypothetical protein